MPAGDIVGIIVTAAARYGANASQIVRVATCESGLDPSNYYGKSRGVTPEWALAHNTAIGLFEFLPTTFYGNGGHSIWDASDQADVAARMFASGRASAWVCK